VDLRSAPLDPVTPLAMPSRRWGRWAALALVAVAVVVAIGVRRDWAEALRSGPAWLHSLLLLTTAASGAWAALRLAVPGEARPTAVVWPLAIAGAWVASIGVEFGIGAATFDLGATGFGWRCVLRAVVGAAVPGAALLYLVQRALPLEVRPTAIALATSTVAIGEFAAEWMCPNMRAMHLIAWHVAPLVIVIGLVAVAPGLALHLASRDDDRSATEGA
jgi:hypothetical protein